MICNLCPQKCNALRNEDKGSGFCGMGTLPKIAKIAPFYWEEPCISGQNGSGAIFFSGCTLKCVFCQNYEISALNQGKIYTIKELAQIYENLEMQELNNINLISGSQFIPAIRESLDIYKPSIPVIFNCGGYERVESIRSLSGYINVYLPDFKYSDDELAMKYSSAKNYSSTALKAIEEMIHQVGAPVFDDKGLIKSGVIVRHLILPNHTKNSINALEMLKSNFGDSILVSLMGQYIPHGRSKEFEKLNRKITTREYDKVSQKLMELELDGFMQELKAADEKYIPKWDL